MKIIKNFALSLLMLTATLTAWAGGKDWMASLPDNVYITQLSIPGAHDAATSGVSSSYAKTQNLTISAQWDAGVRAFDLRPTDESADGPIYHGSGLFRASTGVTLRSALNTLKTKLTDNSTEFAIVIMRNENNSGQDNGKWKSVIKPILDSFNDDLIAWNRDLTLGDVRGKILILARDEVAETKAAKVSGWPDNTQYGTTLLNDDGAFHVILQDYYENINTTTKNNAIKAMLDESTTIHCPNRMYINHTSGYTGSGLSTNIGACAKVTNKYVCDYLDSHSNVGPTGIIMMDFAGSDANYYGATLVNKIIANNNTNTLTPLYNGAAGEYFLQNVESGKWLQGYQAISGADRSRWNTAANMGTYGRPFLLQNPNNDGWTLNTQAGSEKLGCEYGDGNLLYLDAINGPTRWKITGTKDNAYITINHDRWLSVNNNDLLIKDGSTRNTWKLWTRAERIAEMANATAVNPQDVTWLMVNPELMNNDKMTPQWTESVSGGGKGWQDGFRPNRVFETWNYSSMDFYQTISVPNGWYEVQAYALFSPTEESGLCKADYDDYVANGDATVNGYLYANNEQVKLPSIYSFTSSTPVANYAAKALVDGGVSVVDGWWQAARAMGEDNKFLTKPLYVCVTNGQLRLGIKEVNNTNPFKSHWIIIGSFSLKYFGLGTTIDEDVSYTPVAKSNAFVNVKRTITASTSAKPVWNSLVLPFALTAEQTRAAFGDDVQVAEYSENSAEGNNATVNFDTKSSPTIAANVPVLIKTSTAGSTFFFGGVNIAASASPKKTGTNFDFVGSYTTINPLPDNCYFVNGNSLYKSAGQTRLKGTRAYIAPKSGSSNARIVGFSLDGETISTGISSMHNSECIMYNDVFDLQGRKVSKQAQKGVYIINGKKVVVK